MRKTAVIVLADGFEEIEAITPIDVLRRAGVEVIIAGVGKTEVKGSRGIRVIADTRLEDYTGIPEAVILPGGLPGAENLKNSPVVSAFIQKIRQNDKIIAAICAAPALVLTGQPGFLEGKKITCYPGYEKELGPGATFDDERVVTDALLVTSRGPGTAMEFSLELVSRLADERTANLLREKMLVSN